MFPALMPADERPRSLHQAPQRADPPEEASGFSLQGKRAVIAEDEGLTQLQLRRILQSAGMLVVGLAGNGREAVEIVLAKKPDLVVMDIRMPVMDGLEAARRILEQERVCIVMLTAFSDEDYMQEAQEIGACGYVLKPVTSEILLPQLTEALRKFYPN